LCFWSCFEILALQIVFCLTNQNYLWCKRCSLKIVFLQPYKPITTTDHGERGIIYYVYAYIHVVYIIYQKAYQTKNFDFYNAQRMSNKKNYRTFYDLIYNILERGQVKLTISNMISCIKEWCFSTSLTKVAKIKMKHVNKY
jgi:hypothetical protein